MIDDFKSDVSFLWVSKLKAVTDFFFISVQRLLWKDGIRSVAKTKIYRARWGRLKR